MSLLDSPFALVSAAFPDRGPRHISWNAQTGAIVEFWNGTSPAHAAIGKWAAQLRAAFGGAVVDISLVFSSHGGVIGRIDAGHLQRLHHDGLAWRLRQRREMRRERMIFDPGTCTCVVAFSGLMLPMNADVNRWLSGVRDLRIELDYGLLSAHGRAALLRAAGEVVATA